MNDPNHEDLIRRLDAHPLADPPAELHERIMGAIDYAGRIRVRGRERGSRFRLVTTFGLGLATGVVLLLAVVQFGVYDAPLVDPAHVSGSMVEPRPERESLVSFSISEAGVTGIAEANRVGEETRLDVALECSEPVEWVFAFDREAWEVSRVERPAGTTGTFSVGSGEVRGSATGSGRITVALSPTGRRATSAQPSVFKIVKAGSIVFERSVPPISE